MSSKFNTYGRGYGSSGQDFGPGARVKISDQERSGSGPRRGGTMPSSTSPGPSPAGKGTGILKQRTDEPGNLRSIKEDNYSEFGHDDSRGYSATQHDDGRVNQSLSKFSDSRLEESLRGPTGRAEHIPGLVDFLIEEHRNRLGIFTQDGKKLFKFWKRYVSKYYKEERMETLKKKRATNGFSELHLDDQYTETGALKPMKGGNINMLDSGLGPDAMSSFNKHKSQQARKMFMKGQRASSALRLSDKKPEALARPREGGVLDKYEKYGEAPEFDVSCTITKEIEQRNDQQKIRQNKIHYKAEQKRFDTELKAWKDKIMTAVQVYYDYKCEQKLNAHITKRKAEQKAKAKAKPADKDKKEEGKPDADKAATLKKEKQKTTNAGATPLSPGDLKSSLKPPEQSKKEPKPTIFDQLKPNCEPEEYSKIMAERDKKCNSMKTILEVVVEVKFDENFVRQPLRTSMANEDSPEKSMSIQEPQREPGPLMASTAAEVQRLYAANRVKRAQSKLDVGEDEISKLIGEFFDPDEKVLRLNLYKDRINTSRRRGAIPLHAFYLNAPPNDRLAYLFDIPEPDKKSKTMKYDRSRSRSTSPPRLSSTVNQRKDKKRVPTEAERVINTFVERHNDEQRKQEEAARKEAELKEKKARGQLAKQVFGGSFKEDLPSNQLSVRVKGSGKDWELELKNRPDMKKPKDKWKLGKQLQELQKAFPHDRVIQRMIAEEFKATQPFKHPEEYDIRAEAVEHSLKKNFDGFQAPKGESVWKVPDFSREKEIIDTFVRDDTYARRDAGHRQAAEAAAMEGVEQYLKDKALEYHNKMSKRSDMTAQKNPQKTLRETLAEYYHKMIEDETDFTVGKFSFTLKQMALKRFPQITYGESKEAAKHSYPASFKRYFFRLVKSIIVSRKNGRKEFQRRPVTLTMLAPSRVPGLQDPIGVASQNTRLQDFVVGQAAKQLRKRDPKAWRTRAFRRNDQQSKLKNVFMKFSELENCTFEPETGCLNRQWHRALANKQLNLGTDARMRTEATPGEFFDRLGENFCKAEPAIYKRGKLKKAGLFFKRNDVEKCFSTLCEGFHLCQLYQQREAEKYKVWKDFRDHEEKMEKIEKQRAAAAYDKGLGVPAPKLKRDRSVLKREGTDDLNPQQVKEVKEAFESLQRIPPPDPTTKKVGPPYLKVSDLSSAMQKLGQNPREFEINDIEKRIRQEQRDDLTASLGAQEQGQLKRKLTELSNTPIHITYEMFLSIMTIRLKVTLSDNDLKEAFKLFDNDGSGSIDTKEFAQVLRMLGDQFTEEEIEEMVKAADADGSGEIEEDEFVAVMRAKASGGDPDRKLVKTMQQEIKMFLNLESMKKSFKRLGPGLVRVLDQAHSKTEAELKLHPEKKAILTEDVTKPTFSALYEECWALFCELIKREEELERRKTGLSKRQKELEKAKTELKRQQDGDVDVGDEEEDVDGEEKPTDYRKLFKTIMCPLKHECPKLIPPRWPSSKHKSITRFGKNCPYAHHPMELQFPETLHMRIAANKACAARDPQAQPDARFVNAGDLHECAGCGRCNMCAYRKLAQETVEGMAAKLKKKKFAQMDKDKVAERKQANDLTRDNYAKKFGILKKASVLLYYGRANDAFEQIAKAAKIIQLEAESKKVDEARIQQRWQFKLGLNEPELPKPIEKIRPEDVTESFLKQIEAGGADLATLKIYIQQVCPLVRDQNDRNTFLNGLVEDLYHQCEDIMIDKKNTIDNINKNVEQLGAVAELLDQLGSDAENAEAELAAEADEDNPIKIKKKKKKMCELIQKKKLWKDDGIDMKTSKDPERAKDKYWVDNKYKKKTVMDPKTGTEECIICPLGKKCPHAHNPIELDWRPLEDQIKNLKGVVKAQTHQLKNDRPREPWRPSAKNFEPSDLPEYGTKPKKAADEEAEDKKRPQRKGILDREDVFRKPYAKE